MHRRKPPQTRLIRRKMLSVHDRAADLLAQLNRQARSTTSQERAFAAAHGAIRSRTALDSPLAARVRM